MEGKQFESSHYANTNHLHFQKASFMTAALSTLDNKGSIFKVSSEGYPCNELHENFSVPI